MKRKSLLIAFLAVILGLISLDSSAVTKKNPVGKWKFSAPDAPYGYESGIMEIKKEDDTYTVSMKFVGFEYKFECEGVIFLKDKLSFNLYLDGDDIFLAFEFEDKNELAGKAIYSEGELTITAKRTE